MLRGQTLHNHLETRAIYVVFPHPYQVLLTKRYASIITSPLMYSYFHRMMDALEVVALVSPTLCLNWEPIRWKIIISQGA